MENKGAILEVIRNRMVPVWCLNVESVFFVCSLWRENFIRDLELETKS